MNMETEIEYREVIIEGKALDWYSLIDSYRFHREVIRRQVEEINALKLENAILKDIWQNLESVRLKEKV